MESFRLDVSQSMQIAARASFAAINQAMPGDAISPLATSLRELAADTVEQIGTMLHSCVVQSAQSIFEQVGTLVTDQISSYTQTLLDAVAFRPSAWLQSIGASFVHTGRRWSHMLCEDAAQAVQEGDHEQLRWFTTHVLDLPASRETDVAIALWEGRWRTADEPFDYIRKAAGNLARNAYRRDNPRLPEDITLLSLDGSRSRDDPLLEFIGDLCPRFSDIELFADLEQGCQRVNLPPEAFRLIVARLQDFKRDENDGTIQAHIRDQRVQIELAPLVAESLTGQLILFTLLNLLIRLDAYCPRLDVTLPTVTCHPLLRLLESRALPDALVRFFALFPAAQDLRLRCPGSQAETTDLRLVISPRVVPGALSIWADGWIVYLNEDALVGVIHDNTVGANVTAALAAAEVFKRLINSLPTRRNCSAWTSINS